MHSNCNRFFTLISNVIFIYFNTFIYLLMFGCAGSSLMQGTSLIVVRGATVHCSAQPSHCSGFSCCRAQALGVQALEAAACGLWRVGSVVEAHRLNCSLVRGIFPDKELNPCPLHWQVDSYPLYHQGSPQ